MKRLKNIGIICIFPLIYLIFFKLNFEWDCIFNKIFHFACPGCGLTRSLKALLSFDFMTSFRYNILGIPVFIIAILLFIIAIKDFVKNEETVLPLLYKIISKHYKIILVVLLITMIINNINGL